MTRKNGEMKQKNVQNLESENLSLNLVFGICQMKNLWDKDLACVAFEGVFVGHLRTLERPAGLCVQPETTQLQPFISETALTFPVCLSMGGVSSDE